MRRLKYRVCITDTPTKSAAKIAKENGYQWYDIEQVVDVYQECLLVNRQNDGDPSDVLAPLLTTWEESSITYDLEEVRGILLLDLRVLWWEDETGLCDYLTYPRGNAQSIDSLVKELLQRYWCVPIEVEHEHGCTLEGNTPPPRTVRHYVPDQPYLGVKNERL